MPLSPEARIFDSKPSAPTPEELRDGLELLLDTYNPNAVKELTIQVNRSTRVFFKRTFNFTEGRYDFGLRIKDQGRYYTRYVGGIDWFSPDKLLFAVSSNTGIMTEQERRNAGGLILGAWEALAAGKRKPLRP